MIDESRCQQRKCKHYWRIHQDNGFEITERHICAAYPNGIPDQIAFGNVLHIKPFPGDQGIQYEHSE
jgi:hypothetical protein